MDNTDRAKTVQKPCSHGLQNKKAMKSFDFTAFSGAMEGTRTPGPLLRRQLLYPTELLARIQYFAARPEGMERVMGIEPTYPAWKAGVLPLNYTRRVGVTGFEPATSWSQTRRSSQAEPHPEGYVVASVLFVSHP